jgi:hypothetical protein
MEENRNKEKHKGKKTKKLNKTKTRKENHWAKPKGSRIFIELEKTKTLPGQP